MSSRKETLRSHVKWAVHNLIAATPISLDGYLELFDCSSQRSKWYAIGILVELCVEKYILTSVVSDKNGREELVFHVNTSKELHEPACLVKPELKVKNTS